MMIQINAVTTSVIINVTTKVIATAAPVESSSSDSSSTSYVYKRKDQHKIHDRLTYCK